MYCLALVGCIGYYAAHGQWLSWVLLWTLVSMPAAGLLLSLPAMLLTRLQCDCTPRIGKGEQQRLELHARCVLPAPRCSGSVLVQRVTTGEQWRLRPGQLLPTEHCGQLVCTPDRCWVYDYLGLFRLRLRRRAATQVLVEPVPVRLAAPPELERYLSRSWRPKPGGGFSENHELRLYRDGDSLKQIHWKLSAKTGKLIIREAMEPLKDRLLVTVVLSGTAAELDDKFGKLLYMGNHLLRNGLSFEVRTLWQQGTEICLVRDEKELTGAVDRLLCLPPAAEDAAFGALPSHGWHFHIGGDTGEG